MATLNNVFQEFQVIHQLLNTLSIQSHLKLNVLKTKPKHYCNTMYAVFMHGVELYGTWFLEVAQHQFVFTAIHHVLLVSPSLRQVYGKISNFTVKRDHSY